MSKIKIILDADVIIHFSKGGLLSALPSVLPNYEFVVLDTVYDEIRGSIKTQLDNQIQRLKNIIRLPFNPQGDVLKEYAALSRDFGRGESACMSYCKYNHDVIGSSNLRDIENYCKDNQLTYLTTLDFLYFGIQNKVISIEEANTFIREVRAKDSKLPDTDMSTFVSKVVI